MPSCVITSSSITVVNFSLATSRRYKNPQSGEWEEATDWQQIVFWPSENAAP